MACQSDDDSGQHHDARSNDLTDRKSHTVGKIQFFMTFPHIFLLPFSSVSIKTFLRYRNA